MIVDLVVVVYESIWNIINKITRRRKIKCKILREKK